MIATDERFWQSPPQNSSCVSLSPEPCSDSCWSNDSCEQTATCPASSKYSRHNSFTPIEDTVLITLPLSCRVEKKGRTVRRSGKSVYRSMLMDATAADLPSLRQGEGSAWACASLYTGLSAWSAQSNPLSPAHIQKHLSVPSASHHRQSADAAIQRIARHDAADRIVGRIGPSLTRTMPHALVIQARHLFHHKHRSQLSPRHR